jgi:hypothetical protein
MGEEYLPCSLMYSTTHPVSGLCRLYNGRARYKSEFFYISGKHICSLFLYVCHIFLKIVVDSERYLKGILI